MYKRLQPVDAACETAGATTAPGARGEMVVVNKLAGKVEFYRADTQEKLAEIEVAKFPHEVLAAPAQGLAYVSIYGMGLFGKNSEAPGEEIAVIDLATRSKVGAISTLPYKGPHGMAFDAAGLLWVSCDVSGYIIAIDLATKNIVKALPTGSNGTHWLTITPDGNKLYASNKTFPDLVVIDTRTQELLPKIALAPGSEGLALSPDGKKLYVMGQRPQQFYVIDTATDQVLDTVPVSVFTPMGEGKNPQKRVQVSPDGARLVISSFGGGEIAIVPTNDLRTQQRMQVEPGPMGITFNGPEQAYVMNHDAGAISLIDLNECKVLSRFATSAGPETMALV